MADGSHIEWTDATWNPITGCSVHSPGCKHCYAMLLAGTRLAGHPSRSGLTIDTKAGPVWNGEVRLNEGWLTQPLNWTRPRRIFVVAHGDLFHEAVPDEWIDRVFAVMALCPQHQFQVLTKRADRMRKYLSEAEIRQRIHAELMTVGETEKAAMRRARAAWRLEEAWPLPNVWLGVSAENQHWLMQRAPNLVETPAAVRFLSYEPALTEIDIEPFVLPVRDWSNGWLNNYPFHYPKHRLDWVICGGESGPKARPMHTDWARSVRDQCAAGGVAFLFKQWGDWLPEGQVDKDGFEWAPGSDGRVQWWKPEPKIGAPLDPAHCSVRVGKKQAGRRLDGRLHDGYPA